MTGTERLEALQGEIGTWRNTREKLGPMPESLWAKTIELSTELGAGRVARALRLNSSAVTKRMGSRKEGTRKKKALGKFVEVTKEPMPPRATGNGTVIELTLAGGSRLTVRLNEPVDVGALLSNFQARQ